MDTWKDGRRQPKLYPSDFVNTYSFHVIIDLNLGSLPKYVLKSVFSEVCIFSLWLYLGKSSTFVVVFLFDSLHPSQQYFSYVWNGLPGLKKY